MKCVTQRSDNAINAVNNYFQKRISVSIKSLQNLKTELTEKFDILRKKKNTETD